MKSSNIRVWGVFLLLFAGMLSLKGQFTTGLLLDDVVYESLPRQSLYGDGGKSESLALQGISKVDLRPYCPRPRNQGKISSCVGWSMGYAALSIQHAIRNGWKDRQDTISKYAFSALFLYNQVKINECGSGSYISEALKFLAEKGNIPSLEFDREINNCDVLPSATQQERAMAYKIKDYVTLFGANAEETIKINKTKLSLAQNKPVVVGMEIRNNFQQLGSSDTYWFPEAGDVQTLGGHAMCVVGFDDGKEAFELMNSWGEYWGNRGFIWVKYTDFAKYCRYAAQFSLADPTKEVAATRSGAFTLRYPQLVRQSEVVFAELKPTLTPAGYTLQRPLGSRMQLLATQLNSGSYVYVFSMDPARNLKVHWPRDEKLDNTFQGIHESALVTTPQVQLVIPSPQTTFQFNLAGPDQIVILSSSKPITDLNEKLKLVKTTYQGDMMSALRKAFGTRMAPATQITYPGDKGGFTSKTASTLIIPVLFTIDVKP